MICAMPTYCCVGMHAWHIEKVRNFQDSTVWQRPGTWALVGARAMVPLPSWQILMPSRWGFFLVLINTICSTWNNVERLQFPQLLGNVHKLAVI